MTLGSMKFAFSKRLFPPPCGPLRFGEAGGKVAGYKAREDPPSFVPFFCFIFKLSSQ